MSTSGSGGGAFFVSEGTRGKFAAVRVFSPRHLVPNLSFSLSTVCVRPQLAGNTFANEIKAQKFSSLFDLLRYRSFTNDAASLPERGPQIAERLRRVVFFPSPFKISINSKDDMFILQERQESLCNYPKRHGKRKDNRSLNGKEN